ncbi:YigZ family protein [[Eubacterium] yurii subsp. margaretiae ATCC 43715]|nr:YigZ family protein [[Eubacterium] yurii subsp. margaretiae ATCC 43715]
MKSYSTVLSNASAEIVIEKSRFIGQSFHVEDLEETENIIKEVKKKYYDATHNCFAFIMGEDMSIAKANDDGEPSSTAGVPMLEVMKKLNLTNTLVIATRYFGGTKLGASGLIRAYAKTAKIALDANSIVNKKVYNKLILNIDYGLVGKIQKYLENNQTIYDAPIFTEKVEFILYETEEKINVLQKDLLDLTNANCKLQVGDKVYLDFVDGKYLKN